MSALPPAATAQIRQRLDERARHLAALIDAGQRHAEGAHDVTDLKDGAQDETRSEIDGAEAALHLAELRQIELACTRLEAGGYGNCVDCGESIAPARLQAQPAAARCTACQTARERRPGA
jgi:DnaK suppressor protein